MGLSRSQQLWILLAFVILVVIGLSVGFIAWWEERQKKNRTKLGQQARERQALMGRAFPNRQYVYVDADAKCQGGDFTNSNPVPPTPQEQADATLRGQQSCITPMFGLPYKDDMVDQVAQKAVARWTRPGSRTNPIQHPVHTFLYVDAPQWVKDDMDANAPVASGPAINLPANFDSRSQWPGMITGPLDQGNCGNCWAESSATVTSDRFRIFSKTPELLQMINNQPFPIPGEKPYSYPILNNLSPYDLVYQDECREVGLGANNNESCSMGCNGGYVGQALIWAKKNGLSTMKCNPPKCNPATKTCSAAANKPPAGCALYSPIHVHRVFQAHDTDQEKIEKVKANMVTYGPVVMTFSVYQSFYDFFNDHPDGIYTQSVMDSGDNTMVGGHAISGVGYGSSTDPDTGSTVEYWIIRNSWGPNWGDAGFFKMQNNVSGILGECWAPYPTYDNPQFPPPQVEA